MKKNEKGFAVIIALLIVTTVSVVASAGFFVSVADLKISFNRIAGAKSLRDAERVLVEAEVSMEQCLGRSTTERCVSEIADEVAGTTAEISGDGKTFALTAVGRSGGFSTEIQAVYSVQNGSVIMNSWLRKPERDP